MTNEADPVVEGVVTLLIRMLKRRTVGDIR